MQSALFKFDRNSFQSSNFTFIKRSVCLDEKPYVNIVFHVFQYFVTSEKISKKKLSLVNRKRMTCF